VCGIKLPAIASGLTVKLEYSDQMAPDKPASDPIPAPAHTEDGAGRRGAAPPANANPGRGRGGNPTVFPNTFNQRDEIVGDGEALTFRSRFNYHGFRYVRVIGLDSAKKGKFRLKVTIPPGTTATVFLPGKAGVEVAPGAHSFEATL
jgi:hypothetical protein